MKQFDFSSGIQTMDLDTLKRTYMENDPITGKALRGVYHYELIENILQISHNNGLDASITDIFAAQNKDRNAPGVVIAPHVEEKYGPKAIEAHCLRRVYTTIMIESLSNEEHNTGLAIAFHQKGIQVALGPNIRICTNQCILGSERMITTYGDSNKVTDLGKIYEIIDDWMKNFSNIRQEDSNTLEMMKSTYLSRRDVIELIGWLNIFRVGADTRLLQTRYPLNQGQISEFTEGYLRQYKDVDDVNLYALYNLANSMYKADKMDIPQVIPQNVRFVELLKERYLS